MSQPPTLHRHPLGASSALQKVIESFPQQQSAEQTRTLTIIYAKSKLQVEIPLNWTINKVKCMMSIHFVMLNFDKFEFQCNKFLIPGKILVADLPNGELIVTQANCLQTFDTYCQQNMKKVLKKHHISTANSLYPITHDAVTHAMRWNFPKERLSNIEPIPQNLRRGDEGDQQGMFIINFLRIIGIAFMFNLIFTFASYSQMAILVAIGLLYYLIDEYVRYNDRRRRQREREAQRQAQDNRREGQQNRMEGQANLANLNPNMNILQPHLGNQQVLRQQMKEQKIKNLINQKENISAQENGQSNQNPLMEQETDNEIIVPQQEHKPSRKILKAKLIIWFSFTIQAIYCYILSIFPNWTIETHLHANQQKMDKVMDKIKNLDPEASEMVKKWKIKPTELQERGQENKQRNE